MPTTTDSGPCVRAPAPTAAPLPSAVPRFSVRCTDDAGADSGDDSGDGDGDPAEADSGDQGVRVDEAAATGERAVLAAG